MLCFRDRTYCDYTECANKECERRWTDELQKQADRWWGKPGAPVCMFAEKPDCFVENGVENADT